MCKRYNEQAIRNFVSGKGSVMTEEGKRKAKKELSNKATLLLTLLTYFFFTISNAIQLSDINVRVIFVIQMVAIVIWLLASVFYFKIKITAVIPRNKLFQIWSLIIFLITVDLMFVGVLRIVYSDLNLVIPSIILLLQSFGAAIYERKQIFNAINNSDGIMKKPFENIKDLSQGGIYVVVMIVTMIALRENLNLFAFFVVISSSFVTLTISRGLIQQVYKWYFANKYDMRDELFKNVL